MCICLIIFKGTENRSPAPPATVSLNLIDNERCYTLTRTCHLDGESTLEIEGIDCDRHSPQEALASIASAFTVIKSLEDLSSKAQTEGASGVLTIDGIDRDLSEQEVEKYAALVVALSSRFQIIFATENKTMMNSADQITGVTMEEWGITTMFGMRLTN